MSEGVALRWQTHQSDMQALFARLQRSGDMSDVTVTNGSCNIRCHRLVLSAACPNFHNLLKSYTAEVVLYLGAVHSSILQALVEFMYHGQVHVPQQQLNDFLQLATQWGIRGLCGGDVSIVPSTGAQDGNRVTSSVAGTAGDGLPDPPAASASHQPSASARHTQPPPQQPGTRRQRIHSGSSDSSGSDTEQRMNPSASLDWSAEVHRSSSSAGQRDRHKPPKRVRVDDGRVRAQPPAKSEKSAENEREATSVKQSLVASGNSAGQSLTAGRPERGLQVMYRCSHCDRYMLKPVSFRKHLVNVHGDSTPVQQFRVGYGLPEPSRTPPLSGQLPSAAASDTNGGRSEKVKRVGKKTPAQISVPVLEPAGQLQRRSAAASETPHQSMSTRSTIVPRSGSQSQTLRSSGSDARPAGKDCRPVAVVKSIAAAKLPAPPSPSSTSTSDASTSSDSDRQTSQPPRTTKSTDAVNFQVTKDPSLPPVPPLRIVDVRSLTSQDRSFEDISSAYSTPRRSQDRGAGQISRSSSADFASSSTNFNKAARSRGIKTVFDGSGRPIQAGEIKVEPVDPTPNPKQKSTPETADIESVSVRPSRVHRKFSYADTDGSGTAEQHREVRTAGSNQLSSAGGRQWPSILGAPPPPLSGPPTRSRDRPPARSRDRSPALSRDRPQVRSRDRSPVLSRDRSPASDRSPARSRDRSLARSRDRPQARGRDRPPASDRDRSPAGDHDRSPARGRDRSPARSRDRPQARGRDRLPASDRDRSPAGDHDRSPERGSGRKLYHMEGPQQLRTEHSYSARSRAPEHGTRLSGSRSQSSPSSAGFKQGLYGIWSDGQVRLLPPRGRTRGLLRGHLPVHPAARGRPAWEGGRGRYLPPRPGGN